MITSHTDVVGSLLRPQELLTAQEELAAGRMSRSAFKVIEDRAVDEAIALQEGAGLEVLTDGEMRRLSFQSQMTQAVEGFGEWDIDAFLWGEWHGDEEVGDWRRERPSGLGVTGKLARRRHLCAEEFVYLRARTERTPKITLPSPSLFANFWSPEQSAAVYPTLESFLADVVAILRDEVVELVRLGACYIQIDAPHYPLLLQETNRVTLHKSEKDQFGLPVPNVHFDDHPNDVAMRSHAYRQGSAVYDAAGAVKSYEVPPYPSTHNLGTCRMSRLARDGVCNRWGQTHDIKNLFISDGSQFTTGGAENPTLTIVTLAIRQADYLANQLSKKAI